MNCATDAAKSLIRDLLAEKVKEASENQNEDLVKCLTELSKQISSMPTCVEAEQPKKRGRKKRKVTARNVWIGDCMRSAEKGGMAKPMKTCSIDWKGMDDDQKLKYKAKADQVNVERGI